MVNKSLRRSLKMLKKIKSVCSPTRTIHQSDLLLRQGAVANQMFQRDPTGGINLITLKQEH